MVASEGPSESSQDSTSQGPWVLSRVTLSLIIWAPRSLPLREIHIIRRHTLSQVTARRWAEPFPPYEWPREGVWEPGSEAIRPVRSRPPAPARRWTHLDVQTDVHIAGPQAAEAALLLRPAAGVDIGDPRGDPQAAAGGTGAPGAGVGEAVPRPGLRLAHGRCGQDGFPVSLQPPQPAP